jgi:hypothetical protein
VIKKVVFVRFNETSCNKVLHNRRAILHLTANKFSRNRLSIGIGRDRWHLTLEVYYLRQNDGNSQPGDGRAGDAEDQPLIAAK